MGESLSLDALRRDGIHQQQFVLSAPDFYPVVPSLSQLLGNRAPQAIRELERRLRAPDMLQVGVGIERQLPSNIVVAVNYLNSRGWHSLRSRSVSASDGTTTYLYESSGVFRQNQLVTTVNARVSPKFSVSGSYTLNRAESDTDGAGTFASNHYDLRPEYGRAGFDIRHRALVSGTVSAPLGLRLSPFRVVTSGRPFNITVVRDLNGDTFFTDRPALATDLTRPSVRRTAFGTFDLLPTAGQTIIPRNYGDGPGQGRA